MTFLKQNWVKITIGTVILIGILVFGRSYFMNSRIVSTPTPTPYTVAYSKTDLCKEGAFTSPSIQEVNYNKEIAQDKFVQYLRTAINNWLSGRYGSAMNPKSSECSHYGLLDGKQCPDAVYYDANYDPDGIFEEGDYDNDLSKIGLDYLESKFIILQTDPEPRGGKSIVLMFKNKPDKIFYAWIYGYLGENNKIVGFDLRALNEYDLAGNKAPSLGETQKVFINQLCNDSFGI